MQFDERYKIDQQSTAKQNPGKGHHQPQSVADRRLPKTIVINRFTNPSTTDQKSGENKENGKVSTRYNQQTNEKEYVKQETEVVNRTIDDETSSGNLPTTGKLSTSPLTTYTV